MSVNESASANDASPTLALASTPPTTAELRDSTAPKHTTTTITPIPAVPSSPGHSANSRTTHPSTTTTRTTTINCAEAGSDGTLKLGVVEIVGLVVG